jgi:hypothetical protein
MEAQISCSRLRILSVYKAVEATLYCIQTNKPVRLQLLRHIAGQNYLRDYVSTNASQVLQPQSLA